MVFRRICFVLITIFSCIGLGVGQDQQKTQAVNLKNQVAFTLAQGIASEFVSIVLARVPDLKIAGQEGSMPEEFPQNFLEITIAFNLTDIEVLESLKGKVDRHIFIQNIFGFEEALQYQAFTWQPNSLWILLLESPFDVNYPRHDGIVKTIHELKADSFLTSKNFYTIFRNGLGALCVEWPESEKKGELLQVASPRFVDDLKMILQRLEDLANPEKVVEPETEFKERLKDNVARALYDYLMPGRVQ